MYCNSPPVVAVAVVAAVGIESTPAKEAPAEEAPADGAPAMPVGGRLRLGHRQGQGQGQGQHECDLDSRTSLVMLGLPHYVKKTTPTGLLNIRALQIQL